MKDKWRKYLVAVCAILLVSGLGVLLFFSLHNRQPLPPHMTEVHPVSDVTVSINGGEPQQYALPQKLTGLSPRTPVTLYATTKVSLGDSLLFKSSFAPARLYIDGVLAYETGQPGSYPEYMNDPTAVLSIIPLPQNKESVELRAEYLSLTQRSELSLPLFRVGNQAALIASQFRLEGFPLLLSLLLLFLGMGMILVSLMAIRSHSSGLSYLWLGLFSTSAGVWMLGECNILFLFLPYPTLFYNMTYMGLFLVTIPFLCFGLAAFQPRNKLPLQIMLALHVVSVITALVLQFAGKVDFIRSLYWFLIIAPMGFLVFALSLLWEHFFQGNPGAKHFTPTAILLAIATVAEALNNVIGLTERSTLFFQLGVVAFVISLGLISGYYVRQSLRTMVEKSQLEYRMAAATHQLELQRTQYEKIAKNEEAIKAQRHDLRHHLAVLRNLAKQNAIKKLDNYINTLMEKLPSENEMQLSENYAINAVAVHYALAAKAQNITTELHFAIPPELDSTLESDLCVVVGNLLENAVEACARIKTGDRFIRLQSRLEHGVLTILVDNSTDGRTREINGSFPSSKRHGEGMGLSSVKAVAKKYGGAARFEVKDDVFEASVYVRL